MKNNTDSELSLDSVDWKVFSLKKIFNEIRRGKRLKKDDHIEGVTPYVSSTSINNGVDGFIGNEDEVRKYKANLSLANSGSVGSCFYHPYEYIASDHVTALTLPNGNKYIYLFISTVIKRISEKYSFNREINDKRIMKEKILLPIDTHNEPNWLFMENFIKQEERKLVVKLITHYETVLMSLDINSSRSSIVDIDWDEFWLEDVVDIFSGVRLTKADQIEGDTPFIGASDSNNGITGFVSNTNNSLDSNVLGVNYNGSVVENFYHPYEALFSDDVKRIHWKNENHQNKYTYLFLKQMILQQKIKYAYGYKFNAQRMQRQKVLLPVDSEGEINFEFMESYMKRLEAEKIQRLLNHFRKNISNR